ncbi:MAG: hypothetical protein RLY16_2809 [Bacteroidota bacterium]|jgi:pimeloyl-ACP methyl ester carboxylesterase
MNHSLALNFIRLKFKVLALFSPRTAAEKAFDLFCTPLGSSRMRRPSIFYSAEDLTFEMNGNRIIGYRWGHYKGAPKVIILHGFGSLSYKFHRFIHPLMQKGYEVIAFDAPAHGKSEGKSVNALEYCQMIEKASAKYGPFDSFIAHSFGGIALSLALEKQQENKLKKMVLIAPATETTTAINKAFEMLHISSKKVRTHFDEVIYQRSGKKTEWFSINRAIKKIDSKVLWVHDEDDQITPLKDIQPTLDQHSENIEFYITSGLGHKKIYHDKKVQQKIVDFL